MAASFFPSGVMKMGAVLEGRKALTGRMAVLAESVSVADASLKMQSSVPAGTTFALVIPFCSTRK